jgi:hypothetical protein
MNLGNYSVKVVDTNGCEGAMSGVKFYNSIGMEENLESQIGLYPNPTTGLVTLAFAQLEVRTVRLMDAQGRLLGTYEKVEDTLTLDLSDRPSGMYVVLLTTEQGATLRKVIGKQ